MALNVSAIQWIEVIVALLLLIFNVVVFVWVVKFWALPFNKFWKTRAMFVVATFVWILSLILGRDQFWSTGGFFFISEHGYNVVCEVTTLFTYGISQPLFFITLLFMIRSKTNASNDLDMYNKHPNRGVISWSLVWTSPMIIIHIIIVGLNNSSRKDSDFFWTTYDSTSGKCVVPIISTMAFTCFYAIFLVCYIFYSRKFSKTLINKRLLRRVWWSQVFFSLFFPFEVLLRFILIFTTRFQVAGTVLSHIFFFIDLIICLVGLLEFSLFPVLDAAEFPLSSDLYDNLLDKRSYRKSHAVDHSAIILDNVSFEAKKQPSTAAILHTSALATSSMPSSSSPPSSIKPLNVKNGPGAVSAYNNNNVNDNNVEEFRKQMARYSNV